MAPLTRLTMAFAQRMVEDLSANNVLRGSWAEQLVAHYLNIEDLPPNWSYYDMRLDDRIDVSVKHSVGRKPSFSVEMATWAWDPGLAVKSENGQGWRGGLDADPQYWCQVYVFAWLEAEEAAPPLDDVLDAEKWRFIGLSRNQMYNAFVLGRAAPQKTAGITTLQALAPLVPGFDLAEVVRALDLTPGEGVPERRMHATYGDPGPPVVAVSEPLPETSISTANSDDRADR